MEEILENKILELLIQSSAYQIVQTGSDREGYVPIYKKNYLQSTLHFGTLVDMLNTPEKYRSDNLPKGNFDYLKNLIKKDGEINLTPHSYEDVSEAIEVLAANEHVEDSAPTSFYDDRSERKIRLTQKGIIGYRTQFYLKEAERELSVFRGYEIQKKDRWLKKYWLFVEISKYVVGGIVGALIAFGVSRFRNSTDAKTETSISPK
jgi:hypothetical protein